VASYVSKLKVITSPGWNRPLIYTEEPNREEGIRHPLFDLLDIRDHLSDILQRWFVFSKDFSAVCALHFGTQYKRQTYLDLQFQMIIQALTIYGIRRLHPTEFPAFPEELANYWQKIDDEARTLLEPYLRDNPILAADAALRAILKRQWLVFERLLS
jgi:ApeA N-terminal domain 1